MEYSTASLLFLLQNVLRSWSQPFLFLASSDYLDLSCVVSADVKTPEDVTNQLIRLSCTPSIKVLSINTLSFWPWSLFWKRATKIHWWLMMQVTVSSIVVFNIPNYQLWHQQYLWLSRMLFRCQKSWSDYQRWLFLKVDTVPEPETNKRIGSNLILKIP